MRIIRTSLALLALTFSVATFAAPASKGDRPLDATDVARYEAIVDTLVNGGKICEKDMLPVGGGHLKRKRCIRSEDLSADDWALIHEGLRQLKACVAASKPCMPKEKPKEKPSADGKRPVYSNY